MQCCLAEHSFVEATRESISLRVCTEHVPGVQMVGKAAKNRATPRRTATEKNSGPRVFHSLSPVRAFPHYQNARDRLPCVSCARLVTAQGLGHVWAAWLPVLT